jgi:hypothetical protein
LGDDDSNSSELNQNQTATIFNNKSPTTQALSCSPTSTTATATTNKTVEPSLIQPTETNSNKFSNTSSWSSLKNATNTDSSINFSSSLGSGGGNSTLKPIDSFQKYKMQLLEKEERVS